MENPCRTPTKKIKKAAYALFHLSNCAPSHISRQVYYSLVESSLRHGITAYGTSTYCKNLQKTQTRLLKILYKHQEKSIIQNQIFNANNQYTNIRTEQNNTKKRENSNNTKSLNGKLNILSVKNIYKITIINEFYGNTQFLHPISHEYRTRRRTEGRFQIPAFRTNYGKNSLAVTLPTITNEMPTNLLNIHNIFNKKKTLKKYFLKIQQ